MINRVVVLSLLILTGCSYVKGPFGPIEGSEFAAEKVASVEEGDSATVLLDLLGEPLTRLPHKDGERWLYFVREKRVDVVRFAGIPAKKRFWFRTAEAEFFVVDGLILEISYDSSLDTPSLE